MHLTCPAALLLASLTVAAGGLHAADDDLLLSFGGEEFVSIATGQKQPISSAPAVASVITAEQIEAMGANTLDEVLETVPGLHVSLSSTRFSPIYSMRGIYTDKNPQVLMLYNGVPVTHAYLGDRGVRSTMPVRNVARVEVIRGPGSAIYGADAFAGVINVITKDAREIGGTEVGAQLGSFGGVEAWVLNGSRVGEVDIAFSLDWMKTDGDDGRVIHSDSQSLFDSALVVPVSLAPGPADTRQEWLDLRLELGWRDWSFSLWNWRQQDSGVGPGLALALDPDGYSEVDNYVLGLRYFNRDRFDHWELDLRLNYLDYSMRSMQTLLPAGTLQPLGSDGNINGVDPVGVALFTDGLIGNPDVFEQHYRFDGSTFYTGFDRHTVRLAAGYNVARLSGAETKNFGPGVITDPAQGTPGDPQLIDGSLTSVTGTEYNFIQDESRRNIYGSVQDEWAFSADWHLTLGLRYDYYSDFGSTVNPRAALVWNASQAATVKLLYGKAFRAPSFAELFLENNPVALGNPDLKPETIRTGELAVEYRPRFNLRTGANIFYYRIEDLIQFVSIGAGSQVAENQGAQTGSGFELQAEWGITDGLVLSGNYAYQRSRDSEGRPVANAPVQQLYGRLSWRFRPQWHLDARASWIGERPRSEGDPRSAPADYSQVYLVLRRTNLWDRLDLSLIGSNVFGESAYEPSPAEGVPGGSLVPGDFPRPGRGVFGKATVRF